MPISVLKMAVNDPDGSLHPDAVWIPARVVMDNMAHEGGVDWYAYHDAASLAAGRQPIAGVQHHTALDSALYAQVQAFDTGTTIYGAATANALAFLALHVPDPPAFGVVPALDAQGQPVKTFFFGAAQVVQLG